MEAKNIVNIFNKQIIIRFNIRYFSDKITNKVIEDNVDELFNELKPALEKVVTEIYENLLLKDLKIMCHLINYYQIDNNNKKQ